MRDEALARAQAHPIQSNAAPAQHAMPPQADEHTTSVPATDHQEYETLLDKGDQASEDSDDDHDAKDVSQLAPYKDTDEAGALPVANSESRATQKPQKPGPVPWRALPRKDQLLILTLARLAEPLFQASLQAYMFFMLKSFDPSLSDAEISAQAGILTGGFTAAQCLTAVWWGRLADKPWMGRKNIILVGLVGSFFSSIAFGFSKTFWSAMLFRCLGGALNGNVGVMRTVISELIKEKRFQPKAFLILPATFNFGILVGPLLGGWLQDPVNTFPGVFGPGSRLGGSNGVQWMIEYPYALPNLLNAVFFLMSMMLVILGLEETLIDRAHYTDPGLRIGRKIKAMMLHPFRQKTNLDYTHISDDIDGSIELSAGMHSRSASAQMPIRPRSKLPYRRIFTRNVIMTMLTHGLLHVHSSSFNAMWFIFLSTPRFNSSAPEPPSHTKQRLPFSFTGGLGLPPPTIGLAIGIIGFVGLILQFGVYSRVTYHLGIVTTYRIAMIITFPIVYCVVPYLVMVPTKSASPEPADGPRIWVAIFFLLFLHVIGRTFVLPIGQILVNNCSPHPSVLGSVHGIGQSVSSGGRTIGPIIWSRLYGKGLEMGVVGVAWWVLSIEALCAAGASWLLREGSGHEIWLEGD